MGLAFDIGTLLDSDPSHRGGRPFIRGRRVSVQRIAILHQEGAPPEEIARRFGLELAAVHAALAYYFANKAAEDADLDAQDAEYDRLAAEHAPHSLARSRPVAS